MGKEGKRIPEALKHKHAPGSEVAVYDEMLMFLQEHEDKVRQRIIDLLDPWRANNFLALHATPYDEHSYEVIRREPEGYLDSPIYYQRGMANTLVLFLQAKYEQTRVVVLRQVSHSSDYGVQLLKQRMLEKTNTNHKHTHSHRKHYQKKRNFKHRYLLLVHGIRTQLPMQKQNPILILWLMWLQVFLKNFLRMVHGT